MRHIIFLLVFTISITSCHTTKQIPKLDSNDRFDSTRDLLLAQYDCKTDVDDLHSVAAFATLLKSKKYKDINYHAVAGTYGTQGGLYVPSSEIFQLAFGDNWSDAHADRKSALSKVFGIAESTLSAGGSIWIAEAGQSDFSADLVKMIKEQLPQLDTRSRIHIVQHSDWNEQSTTPDKLQYAQLFTNYHKIADGNVLDNGTPGYNSSEKLVVQDYFKEQEIVNLWQITVATANEYNGNGERYLNKSIKAGGLDFSDFSEICWMLGIEDLRNAEEFFRLISKQ